MLRKVVRPVRAMLGVADRAKRTAVRYKLTFQLCRHQTRLPADESLIFLMVRILRVRRLCGKLRKFLFLLGKRFFIVSNGVDAAFDAILAAEFTSILLCLLILRLCTHGVRFHVFQLAQLVLPSIKRSLALIAPLLCGLQLVLKLVCGLRFRVQSSLLLRKCVVPRQALFDFAVLGVDLDDATLCICVALDVRFCPLEAFLQLHHSFIQRPDIRICFFSGFLCREPFVPRGADLVQRLLRLRALLGEPLHLAALRVQLFLVLPCGKQLVELLVVALRRALASVDLVHDLPRGGFPLCERRCLFRVAFD